MKKRNLFRVICCLLAILLLLAAGSTQTIFAEENDTVKETRKLIDGILAQKGDVFLTENAGVGAEWYVVALQQYGKTDFAGYEQALLAYLKETEVYAATTRQKYALALIAARSENEYIQSTVNDSIGQQGIMSWVFGLRLLNKGCVSDTYTKEDVKNTILSLQLEDGGWAVTGTVSDVDVTAMAVQAFAPDYATDEAVQIAVDKAISLLSQRQQADGTYMSYGVCNAESTAQVMIALSSLDIDWSTDSRFIKNEKTLLDGLEKYKLADGSFSHILGGDSNEMATSQALCALVAYAGAPTGESTEEQMKTPQPEKEKDYKIWACVAIAGVGVIVCLVLFFLKKRHIKNFIAVLLATALCASVVLLTDIQSADDYYDGGSDNEKTVIGTVTMTIRCDTVSEDVILEKTEFSIAEGDTVFTILTKAAQTYKIHLDYSGGERMPYVKGIQYLYELQYGDLSGWVYRVNGKASSVGCGEYKLQDGDEIAWHYSCNLGNDV